MWKSHIILVTNYKGTFRLKGNEYNSKMVKKIRSHKFKLTEHSQKSWKIIQDIQLSALKTIK